MINYIFKTYIEAKRKIPDFLVERLHGTVYDTLYRAIEELTAIEIDSRVFTILREFFLGTASEKGLKKWESFYLPKPNILSVDRWRNLIILLNKVTAEGPTIANINNFIKFFDPLAELSSVTTLPLYAVNSNFDLPSPPNPPDCFPTKQYTILSSTSKFGNIEYDYYSNGTEEFILLSNNTILYKISNIDISEPELRIFFERLLNLIIPANVHILIYYKTNIYKLLCYSGLNAGEEKRLIEYNIKDFTNLTTKLDDYKFGGIDKMFLNVWKLDSDRRLFRFNHTFWVHSVENNTYEKISLPGTSVSVLSVAVCSFDNVYFVVKDGSGSLLYRYNIKERTLTLLTPLFIDSDEYIIHITPLSNGSGLLARTTNANNTKNRMYTLDVHGETQAYFFNMFDTIYPIMVAIDFYSLIAYDSINKRIKFFSIHLNSLDWGPSYWGIGGLTELQLTFDLNSIVAIGYNEIILNARIPTASGFSCNLYRIKFRQNELPSPIVSLSNEYNIIYLSPNKQDLILYNNSSNPFIAVIYNYKSSPIIEENAFRLLPAPPSYDIISI